MNDAVTLDHASGARVGSRPIATLPLQLTINDQDRTLQVEPRTTLLDLTGSKKGCDHGR